MSENPPCVFDNGSGMMKAGVAGEEAPRACFPSVVGTPKYEQIQGADNKDKYIGADAVAKRGVLNLHYPVANGVVTNWEYMEDIWKHTFDNELKICSEDQPVMITEAPLNPKLNREKMIQLMMENFKVPSFYVSIQAVLALYASGRTTGVVLDSGDGVTHCVSIFEGFSIRHATTRSEVAGRATTEYFCKLVNADGLNLRSGAEQDIGKEMKEKICYVALEYDGELKKFETDPNSKIRYELPDGKIVHIGSAVIQAPELLFQPALNGLNSLGAHLCVYNTIQASDIDLRRELYSNITLSGGSTMFESFPDRLNKEVSSMVSSNVKVKVIAPTERKYSIWIGGSVLATLATFQSSWITQAEYQEVGVSIVHRKCV